MNKAYAIECRTGCSCCSGDNHYRGPYKTKEDAERRIKFFKTPDSGYCPVASQFARRGSYCVEEITIEDIGGNRSILDDSYIIYNIRFINVNDDGNINEQYGSPKDEFHIEIFNEIRGD